MPHLTIAGRNQHTKGTHTNTHMLLYCQSAQNNFLSTHTQQSSHTNISHFSVLVWTCKCVYVCEHVCACA